MRFPRLAHAVTLVLLPAGISAQALRSYDSAGTRIVVNPARLTFPVNLKLGAKAILDVGGLHDANPEEEFNANQAFLRGVRFSDGGLAVIDVNKVKFFDAKGRLLKVSGRAGDGPGEFRDLTSICRTRGDTIVVADRTRLGIFDKRGTFVRHLATDNRSLPQDGCFDDGTFLLAHIDYDVPTPLMSTTHLYRVSLDGATVVALGAMAGGRFDRIIQGDPTWAAVGRRLVVGDGTRTDMPIFQLSPPGASRTVDVPEPTRLMAPIISIRTADRTTRLSDADVERRIAMTLPTTATAAQRAARMEQLQGTPHAATWPMIGPLFPAPDGSIWVADYLRSWPSATGYSRFDSNGRLVGRLVIPAGTALTDRYQVIGFGIQDILVRRWDEDGATHLTVYPIVAKQ